MKLLGLFKRVNKKKHSTAIALMYHRVAEISSDPWNLAVCPEHFESHLKVLANYNVISLNELDKILYTKQRFNNSIILTFDDGYSDNYQIAKPFLKNYGVPATFFITSGAIGNDKEFWWDGLERICFSKKLPNKLTITKPCTINLETGPDPVSSLSLYHKLCDVMRNLTSSEQVFLMDQLEQWADNHRQRSSYLPMSSEQLSDFMNDEQFTFGGHSHSHAFLPNLSFEHQKHEISTSIETLNKYSKTNIKYFAYPHGGFNQESIAILKELDVKLSFTTEGLAFSQNVHNLAIPRFQVENWNADTFEKKIRFWLGID